jgi:DNA-binding response OmpR family regulator
MNRPILLVDDDAKLCALLAEYLVNEGFEATSVHSGEHAIEILSNLSFDAMVLDIMMPGMNGFEVLSAVRSKSAIPIIMLTGRGDDIDRILGLEMGADDYLAKPCNPRELAARLRAVVRRSSPIESTFVVSEILHVNGIMLNSNTFEATFNGSTAILTMAEFNVLKILMRSAGTTLSKEYLTREALHREFTQYDRSIDVHVSRIRHKLMSSGLLVDIIRSVRGVGYQMLSLNSSANE